MYYDWAHNLYKERQQVASVQRQAEPIPEVLINMQCSLRNSVILVAFLSFHTTPIHVMVTHGVCHPSQHMKVLAFVG